MAQPLGKAYIQVEAVAQGLRGTLAKAVTSEAGKAGQSAGSLLAGKLKGAIVAAGVGTALVAGFKSAIAETGQLQQSYLGGLDTLYGEAADKAREYARAAQEAGISQRNYAEQAVSFGAALKQAYGGDTTQALEAANKAILDMADNAAKMGTPLQSIQDAYQGFAKQNYTMLDNLKLGYGGTKSEMERLLADAEKISGVKYDISNLGDVYEAIHVIQGELGLTGVAADEAKNTLTGSFEGMKAAWQNLLGNVGLGENVESSMQTFTDAVSNYLFNNLIPTIGNILASMPTLLSGFISSGIPQLLTVGTDMVTSIADGMKETLPTLISDMLDGMVNLSGQMLTGISKFVDVGLKLIETIAQGIIANIPKLIQTAPKIITNLANIVNNNAPKIISVGLNIVKSLVIGIIKAIPLLVKSIPQLFKAFVAVWEAVNWLNLGKIAISGLKKGLEVAGPAIKKGMEKVKDFILAPMRNVISHIKSIASKIKSHLNFGGLAAKVKAAFNQIKNRMTAPIQAARDTIKRIVNKLKGFFPLKVGKIFSNLKIPKINIKGGKAPFGIGGLGKKPSIGISWHQKAMENPYLFSGPTLFGAGEKGDEMLYGRNALLRDIAEATNGGQTFNITMTVNGADDGVELAQRFARELRRQVRMGAV